MVFILEELVVKTQVSKAIDSVISLDYKTLKCKEFSIQYVNDGKASLGFIYSQDGKLLHSKRTRFFFEDLTNPISTATEMDLAVEMDSTDDSKLTDYGRHLDFEEQILSEHFYDSVNYSLINPDNQSSSARISQVQDEETYQSKDSSTSVDDTASEILSTEDAKEMVTEIQYAAVLGTLSDLSLQKRQQLANWTYFEKAALEYFLANEGVTREVNFSKVV